MPLQPFESSFEHAQALSASRTWDQSEVGDLGWFLARGYFGSPRARNGSRPLERATGEQVDVRAFVLTLAREALVGPLACQLYTLNGRGDRR